MVNCCYQPEEYYFYQSLAVVCVHGGGAFLVKGGVFVGGYSKSTYDAYQFEPPCPIGKQGRRSCNTLPAIHNIIAKKEVN